MFMNTKEKNVTTMQDSCYLPFDIFISILFAITPFTLTLHRLTERKRSLRSSFSLRFFLYHRIMKRFRTESKIAVESIWALPKNG